MFNSKKSILQKVDLQLLNNRSVNLFIKRDDLIDEFVSGNKWRKLKYNIQNAQLLKKEGVLTFGGAFSNHLLATASACNSFGLKSIGIVRGNELNSDSNETLKRCNQLGMLLVFVSREEYHLRNEKFYQEELLIKYTNFYCIPEGGSNYYGIIGCQEILQETPNDYDHVFVAQGTTTTSAGVALSIPEKTILHVVPVLKGFNSLEEMRLLYNYSGLESGMIEDILSKINVLSEYHFGGYGKYTTELLTFMESFFKETGIPIDPIYTGKTLFALMDWVEKKNVQNSNLLFIHTGGIKGGKEVAEKEGSLFY
jgi:1-aminocyclopropane-1-carboxylate deaminase